jgi:hypothetical protein
LTPPGSLAGRRGEDGRGAPHLPHGGYGGRQHPRDRPAARELFSETNDNSVAILLTYATARVLLACDAKAREECRQAVRARGLKRWLGGRYIPGFDRTSTRRVPTLTLVAVQIDGPKTEVVRADCSSSSHNSLVMCRSAVRVRSSAVVHIRSGVKTQSDAKASVWNRSRSYC